MYSVYRLEFLLPVAVTLSGAVLFLFLLLLCVNLYYGKNGDDPKGEMQHESEK